MELDSNGKPPQYNPGDRVCVLPLKLEATVIKQHLSYDYQESFWGNVILQYDDGVTGICNSWQIKKIEKNETEI
jgi:hypothetical protein